MRKYPVRHRLLQIGNACSQLVNSCLPGGWSDESLSSRSWRMSRSSAHEPEHRGWGTLRRVIDALLGPDHCQRAYLSEVARSQVPPALRSML
jgi:hypothetical protein